MFIPHSILKIIYSFRKLLLIIVTFISCFSCSPKTYKSAPALSNVHIVDRNGVVEIINSQERLKQFATTNFLLPQPYQKVTRTYKHDKNGNIHSKITSYHPNGQPKQYLEAINARAFGQYKEWYPNGCLKLETSITGGIADLSPSAEQSWLFDGKSQAWEENGSLSATIYYAKGVLDGNSLYYHDNGQVWKVIPYKNNQEHGNLFVYQKDGSLLSKSSFFQGYKDGPSFRYWQNNKLASEEFYKQNLLEYGKYYDPSGSLLSEVKEGNGKKVLFGRKGPHEIQSFQEGLQEGLVQVFDEQGLLCRTYHIKDRLKHGEELEFYPNSAKKKISIHWHSGIIQGLVKTWYSNGSLESQREVGGNKKNGLSTAWYWDGSVMLIEQYENDLLLKGEYFKIGNPSPTSKVIDGSGIATIYEPKGSFLRKIYYKDGKPNT